MKKLYYIIFFALLLVMAGCGVKVPEKNVTDMPRRTLDYAGLYRACVASQYRADEF